MIKLTKTEEDIRKEMYKRWPDKGTAEQQLINMSHRIGFYECWQFVNGTFDNQEKEKKKIAKSIYDRLMKDRENKTI